MNRDLYRTIIRTLFAVIFIGGGISHFYLGRAMPADYAGFGETALLGWLTELWAGFVMPNIGWLTIAIGIFELACGIGLLLGGRSTRVAAAGILGFLIFITVLGYGWQTTGLVDDLLKSRIITAVMAAMTVPLLTGVPLRNIRAAWRQATRLNRPVAGRLRVDLH